MNISTLVPVARFWKQPPELEKLSGATEARYEKAQEAYVMDAAEGAISFSLAASETSPLKNPCFVIRNREKGEVNLSIDGMKLSAGKDFRYGYIPVKEGFKLVLPIQGEGLQPLDLSVSYC